MSPGAVVACCSPHPPLTSGEGAGNGGASIRDDPCHHKGRGDRYRAWIPIVSVSTTEVGWGCHESSQQCAMIVCCCPIPLTLSPCSPVECGEREMAWGAAAAPQPPVSPPPCQRRGGGGAYGVGCFQHPSRAPLTPPPAPSPMDGGGDDGGRWGAGGRCAKSTTYPQKGRWRGWDIRGDVWTPLHSCQMHMKQACRKVFISHDDNYCSYSAQWHAGVDP